MNNIFVLNKKQGLVYYGNSDLLAAIADEIQVNPNSCFSKNLLSWYNTAYAETQDFTDCHYQVEIDNNKCQQKPPSTPQDVINILVNFVKGDTRGAAQSVLRIICREALRQTIQNKAPKVIP